jgi:hypothetical protein
LLVVGDDHLCVVLSSHKTPQLQQLFHSAFRNVGAGLGVPLGDLMGGAAIAPGFVFSSAFAGIRDVALARRRCPCAGRHLLSLPPQRK